MRFLLLIGGEPRPGTSSKDVCESPAGEAWVAEMERRGMFASGELLRPPGDAATVRVRNGEVLVSDGPFAETKEQVGGITVLECASLDEAVEAASTHPSAQDGVIEVRPIWDL
jgi:hypothetical protein